MPTESPYPAEEYIGKRLLVGLTYVDVEDKKTILKKEQLFGKIKSYSPSGGLILDRSDGKGDFSLPPDLGTLEKANPGRYTLLSGILIIDPDFIATWQLLTTKESIDDLHKGSGNVRHWEKTEDDGYEKYDEEDEEDEEDGGEYDEDDEGYP